MSNVNVSIRDELFFIDRNSLKVYEAYQINEVQVTKYLGKFYDDTDKLKLEFMPSENYVTPLVKRRNNFHGLQLNGFGQTKTENFSKDEVTYSKDGKTYYDITNLQKDPQLFFTPFGVPILQILQKQLNFTSHLYIQKGQALGSPQMLDNGTIQIENEYSLSEDIQLGNISDVLPDFFNLELLTRSGELNKAEKTDILRLEVTIV